MNNQNDPSQHLPTRDEKIEYIYKVMADKNLFIGCEVGYNIVVAYIASSTERKDVGKYRMADGAVWSYERCQKEGIKGNKVMIGDVFHYLRSRVNLGALEIILEYRDEYNKPIEKQNEGTVSDIYDYCIKYGKKA